MEFLRALIFASDAELLALWGAGFLLLAAFATYMEKRRTRRTEFDRVGWVPWFGIFFVSVIFGGGLLALAVPGMLRG
ncbi:hypothetical protein [Erythrobacter litoralis]|uniref:Uncharacterized protein n=1 Tax=Erythrobacter litoralis (strain HTCC2594) TaxID=314225 RepID=Q2NCL7_ERYLH|nr:hypothetical protein [Erythrobacter litoralis]ABC62574.1 hypothetical protein ELI_02410 [Erythrobacter litoralis HTCC2594]